MNKKRSYVPPIPKDRLEAMQLALIEHIYAGQVLGFNPLSATMASEIEAAIVVLLRGPRRPLRATRENLLAAAITRDIIKYFKAPQEDAVLVAFANANGVDAQSLARTYRNLLPKLAESEWSVAADPNLVLAAYYQTKHYQRKKSKRGRIKGK